MIFCGINTVFSMFMDLHEVEVVAREFQTIRGTTSSCFIRPRTLVVAGSAFQDGADSNQVSCLMGGRVGEDLESPPSS